MATFGSIVSPAPNILFDPAKLDQDVARFQANQLLQRQRQQELNAHHVEYVARGFAPLLELNDEEAAKRYPATRAFLQSQGFAPQAPEQYPGKTAIQQLVSMAIPAADQYKMQGATSVIPTPTFPGAGAPGGAAPGGLEGRLGQAESGGNPAAVNKQGYSGTYQFGAARMKDLGYYQPAEGEDLSKNEWKGKLSIPPFAVTNRDEFLKNPAAQRAVFQSHMADIDKAIAATPGAERFDRDGLRAVAHLGGVGGMQRFVASGGSYSPSDANGTSLTDYYKRFSGTGAPALAQAPTLGSPPAPDAQPPVAPNRQALRLGGTAVAGPGAGPDAAPPSLPSPFVSMVPGGAPAGPTGPAAPPAVAPPNALAPPPAPAQPPAAQPPAQTAQPPFKRPEEMDGNRLTRSDYEQLRKDARVKTGAQISEDIQQRQARNEQTYRQYLSDVEMWKARQEEQARHRETLQMQRDNAQRLTDAEQRRAAAETKRLELDVARYNNERVKDARDVTATLDEIAPKILEGTATDEERRRYSRAMETGFLKPHMELINGAQVLVPGRIPPGYPAWDYRPTKPDEPPAPPSASTEPKVIAPAPPKEPPQKVAEGLIEQAANLRKIDETVELLAKNPGAVGPAYYIPLSDTIGDWRNPESAKLRALIADIGSLKLHDRSGAAISAAEWPRLRPFIPSIKDSPEVIRNKLHNFFVEVQGITGDTYEIYGPKAGYRPLQPVEDAIARKPPATEQKAEKPPPSGFKVIGQ